MQIWAGLGNPGDKYALHRHNVGFMAVDAIAAVHSFGPWQKKFRSLVSEGRIARYKVLLLKPQTYMNVSGDAATTGCGRSMHRSGRSFAACASASAIRATRIK